MTEYVVVGWVAFTPYEGELRWVDGKLQAHPTCPSGRRFVGGYTERDEHGHWKLVRTDGGS